MKESELSNDEKNFLRLIARNIWIARREGAIVGCLYTLGVVLLGYVATTELRWTDPMSTLRCSGVLVIGGGANVLVGAPDTVADEMVHWIDEANIDGLNLAYTVMPEWFEDFIALVVPELQSRGRYKRAYEPGSSRHNLFGRGDGLRFPHPGADAGIRE